MGLDKQTVGPTISPPKGLLVATDFGLVVIAEGSVAAMELVEKHPLGSGPLMSTPLDPARTASVN